jgi:hypothetical protein
MILLFRWGFPLFLRLLNYACFIFGPLVRVFVAGAFVLLKWANVKVTVKKK